MTRSRPMFHVGILVPDLAAAQAEISAAQGVTWRETRQSRYGDWDIRVVYAVEGPPYVELIEGPEGSPWASDGGPRLDHFGIWSEDVAVDVEAFMAAGFVIDFDPRSVGKPLTFCYLRGTATGTRIELVSTELRRLRGLA